MYAIETKALTKSYGKARGIIDINLRIKEGEIYGFIGPNGAGKSTTIRLLLGLLFPSSGGGNIYGLDMVKDSSEIKKKVGFVPSEIYYYDNMTIKHLMEYSARFYKVSVTQRLKHLAEAFELDLDRKIDDLSQGNKKKVAIIQSLLHQPRLLILDEPTSGLDPLIRNRFFDLLKEENARGITVFFSSHVLSHVEKLCHRVAIIKEGKIINEDSISAIKEKSVSRVTYQLKSRTDTGLIQLEGVISPETSGNRITFLYQGDRIALLKNLSQLPIETITIEEPDLEEVFMHYYDVESKEI
jgi:ABC-2 type transport system ATP-binding protein